MADDQRSADVVKKRDLLALTLIYCLVALMLIGLAVLTTGDCGAVLDEADRGRCLNEAAARRFYGLILAVVGYPLTLSWYVRRRRRRGGQA